MPVRLFVAVIFGLFVVSTTFAQPGGSKDFGSAPAKPQHDDRVKKLLDEAELKYDIDSDGDFRLINNFDDGRSQLVFVFSNTQQIGSLEVREVWSVGYLSEDKMPDDVVRNLLQENSRVKLGAWELGVNKGREMGVFRSKLPADTDVATMLIHLQAVSKTADEKEKELHGNDDR